MKNAIGRYIEADMILQGVSKKKMAMKIGKTERTLSRYLSGDTIIPLTVLIDMKLLPETWEKIRKGGK